ncbi:MAG: hypothetical protein ACREU7_00265 [Burkholderiales bacterium]
MRVSGPDVRAPEPQDAALAADLFCLQCGYNLRGLSGDPIRCPECGRVHDIGAWYDEYCRQIRAQHAKAADGAAACVGSAAVATLGVLFVIGGATQGYVLAFVGGLGWFAGAARFRRYHRGPRPWLGALLARHAYAAIAIVCGVLLVLGSVVGWIGISRLCAKAAPALSDAYPVLTGILSGILLIVLLLCAALIVLRIGGWLKRIVVADS